MKKSYAVVQQENGSLVGEYLKRTNNHQELIATLKELNNMIRNASNLRVGAAQKRVVGLSRDCIKNNTTAKIAQVRFLFFNKCLIDIRERQNFVISFIIQHK
jgi:Bardet-Biedl syndrome 2 protein